MATDSYRVTTGPSASMSGTAVPAYYQPPSNDFATSRVLSGHATRKVPPEEADNSGQSAPPGMEPRVTAILWADEVTRCFQVDANGVVVARREDNNFINGTALLDVAGLTPGRRNGILQMERTRQFMNTGPMYLWGVWIPFNRALRFANKENITDQLYPLFVHNIGALMFHPVNAYGATTDFPIPNLTPVAPGTKQPSINYTHSLTVASTAASSTLGIGSSDSSYNPSYDWEVSYLTSIAEEIRQPSVDFGVRVVERATTPAATPPASPRLDMDHTQSEELTHWLRPAPDTALRQYQDAISGDRRQMHRDLPHVYNMITQLEASEISESATTVIVAPDHAQYQVPPNPHVLTHTPQADSRETADTLSERDRLTYPTLGLPLMQTVSTNAPCRADSVERWESFSNTADTSPTTSMVSTEAGVVPRSDANDRTIAICSRILLHIYGRISGTSRTRGTEAHTSSNPKTVSKSSGKRKSLVSKLSQNKGKRKRVDDDESADEGSGKEKRTRHTESEQSKGFEKPLACPFNKFDNRLFGPDSSDESYHSCATFSAVLVAHLKQHLRRNHYLPKHYCHRCCREDFTSAAMVKSHLRQEPMCRRMDPPRYPERIDPEVFEELNLDRKNTPGTSREEYWHRVHNAFFPGAADRHPVTPYYEGPAAEHLERFLQFSYSIVGDLWTAVQRRRTAHDMMNSADMASIQHEILHQAGQLYLLNMAASVMPTLGRPQQGGPSIGHPIAPLDQVPQAPEVNSQRARLGPNEQIGNTESHGNGSSQATTSDVSSPVLPRTPQVTGGVENHYADLALDMALANQGKPYQNANVQQFGDAISSATGIPDQFGPSPQLPWDFNFDLEFGRMSKLGVDELSMPLTWIGSSWPEVD